MRQPLPEKITAAWKGPPSGYKNRNPAITLLLEAEFDQDPFVTLHRHTPNAFFTRLLILLGDHAVDISIYNDSPQLHTLDLPLRSREHGIGFHTPLSWLATPDNWQALVPLFELPETSVNLEAVRGGGKHRHQVWRLELSAASPHLPALMRLFLRTRHIPSDQTRDFNDLVLQFFTLAAEANAYYGRGDYRMLEDFWFRQLNPQRLRQIWEDSARRTQPIVPDVHRYNFLNAARVEKLGGLDALQQFAQRRRNPGDKLYLTINPIGSAALIHADPLLLPLQFGALWHSEEELAIGDDALWLLAEFSKANMLAVQHLGWVLERADRPPVQVATSKPKRRTPIESWLKDLRTRPPSFLNAAAIPAPPEPGKNLAGHGEQVITQFLIVPRDKTRRATTIYGAPTSDSPLLRSPIRAGSLKPERALFEFDLSRHGWDGAHAAAASHFPSEPRRLKQLACPRCDGRHFELRASFEYPEDLFDEDSLSPDQLQHAQNFFSWFLLNARCPACNWTGVVADIECA